MAERTEGRRRRRRPKIAVVVTGAVAVMAAVVIGATVGLPGGEGPLVAGDSTTQSKAEPVQTAAAMAATSPTTPTAEIRPAATSPGWAARSQTARQKALQLGEAVISSLEGSLDLGSPQKLVEDSGRAGLAEMLSLLSAPTGVSVERVAGTDSGTQVQVRLSFAEADATQRYFTLSMMADADAAEITFIEAGPAAP